MRGVVFTVCMTFLFPLAVTTFNNIIIYMPRDFAHVPCRYNLSPSPSTLLHTHTQVRTRITSTATTACASPRLPAHFYAHTQVRTRITSTATTACVTSLRTPVALE